MSVTILRANALNLPLADASADLVVTSPPYFGIRSYQDGGEHYEGQIGSEVTPTEFMDALIAATREMVRVLKPSGSIFVNLGDKYVSDNRGSGVDVKRGEAKHAPRGPLGFVTGGMRQKSLMGIPWRYALRCIDDLGLILRAEIIWSKPNGLPESVTDRVRRSHEQWFHFTKEPHYYSAVDDVREDYAPETAARYMSGYTKSGAALAGQTANAVLRKDGGGPSGTNPLGKLPGSVWTIPTEPLRVPESLGIDHFAAFPTEWPRRIITGWSPRGVCVECGEGRRPVIEAAPFVAKQFAARQQNDDAGRAWHGGDPAKRSLGIPAVDRARTVTGYACACPDASAPTTPGVVLDPFGGTGTTALVADALGRHGITVDMSADYCRLAEWRTTDPGQRAKAAMVAAVEPVPDEQLSLFEETS